MVRWRSLLILMIFQKKGWKAKVIEHYEKFLVLWKDADPGIAEIEDARKRLAGQAQKMLYFLLNIII